MPLGSQPKRCSINRCWKTAPNGTVTYIRLVPNKQLYKDENTKNLTINHFGFFMLHH